MGKVILQIFWLFALPIAGAVIWYRLHLFRIKGWTQLWNKMCRVGNDKLWHFILFGIGFYFLMLLDIALNLWWWIAITIAEAGAIGKEVYDRYKGKERKFDNRDLLADQIGFGIAFILLKLAIFVILRFV